MTVNRAFTTKDAAGSTELNDSDANPNGYNTDKIRIAPGKTSATGAGFIVPASISNRVWEDVDGDGIQDSGEPGVANVEVKLFKDNSNISQPDTLLSTTRTNADGLYSFVGLNAFITYRAYSSR